MSGNRRKHESESDDVVRASGRIPPQHLEAEQAVLGALILDNQALYKLPSTFNADAFYFTGHRDIFEAMQSMLTGVGQADILTLTEELKRRDTLKRAGGTAYVASLTNAVPSSANVAHYAKIVTEAAQRRRLIHAHSEAVALAHDHTITDIAELQKRIDDLVTAADVGGEILVRSEKDIARALLRRIQESLDSDDPTALSERAIKTGLACIDRVLRIGFQDFVVVAADSGGGKSVFMQQVVRHVGMGAGARKVLVVPLEMSGEQMVQRRVMDIGNVYLDDVYRPRNEPALDKIVKAIAAITHPTTGSNVEYVEKCWDLPTILREASRQARRCICPKRPRVHLPTCEGLQLLVIDYLQILDFDDKWGDRREEQIGKATRLVKRWSGLHDVPSMLASQLRRRRDDEVPRLSHLRESGSIGNDASAVGIIYRPVEIRGTEEFERRDDADLRKAVFILEKQRQGPAGVEIPLVHHFEHSRFADPIDVDAAEPAQAAMQLDGQKKPKPGRRGAHG